MTYMVITGVFSVWMSAEGGALEQLSPLTQAGVLIGLLAVCLWALKAVFNLAMKAKDEQITGLKDQVKAATERADKYESKLLEQQQRVQTEVLGILGEASNTTRRALEITRGSHDDR